MRKFLLKSIPPKAGLKRGASTFQYPNTPKVSLSGRADEL
jgi:hypothetical protein